MTSYRRTNDGEGKQLSAQPAGASGGRDLENRAWRAIANCLAGVEGYPDEDDWGMAEDVLLALANAGIGLTDKEEWPDGIKSAH